MDRIERLIVPIDDLPDYVAETLASDGGHRDGRRVLEAVAEDLAMRLEGTDAARIDDRNGYKIDREDISCAIGHIMEAVRLLRIDQSAR